MSYLVVRLDDPTQPDGSATVAGRVDMLEEFGAYDLRYRLWPDWDDELDVGDRVAFGWTAVRAL